MSWKEQVVAVLPTGAGKSLLLMLPCALPEAGITVLVVPDFWRDLSICMSQRMTYEYGVIDSCGLTFRNHSFALVRMITPGQDFPAEQSDQRDGRTGRYSTANLIAPQG